MSDSEHIAARIKELRANQKLTLEEVADFVGVGKSTVRKWEVGQIKNMRRDKIAKLAIVLHTSPAYLMGWDEEQGDRYSVIFREQLSNELELINKEDISGVPEAEYDYNFLVRISESTYPLTLEEACEAADAIGCRMSYLLLEEDENGNPLNFSEKNLNANESALRDEREIEIMRLIGSLNSVQKDFVIALLEKVISKAQQEPPAAPASAGETTPGSERPDQT